VEQHYIVNPEDVALFDVATARNGLRKPFDYRSVAKPWDNMFLDVHCRMDSYRISIEKAKTGVFPKVVMGLIDDSEANAFAFKDECNYFIGVNAGMIVLLQDLFFRLLCIPSVFSELGEGEDLEQEEIQRPRFILDASELPRVEDCPIGLSVAPTNERRRNLASYLANIALEFLFIHEWQHIEGGHLDFLAREHATFSMGETDRAWSGGTLMSQLLEMDADAAAARWSAKITLDESNDHWRFDPGLKEYFRSKSNRFKAWSFSIGTLFRLMDEATKDSRNIENATHPPVWTRYYLVGCISGYVSSGLFSPRKLERLASEIFGKVDCALKELHTEGVSAPGIGAAFSKEGADRMDHLIAAWPEFRSQLELHAGKFQGSNAPPDYFYFYASK
jgi:hypothetical protein